jgi:hypothetical protein
MFESFVQETILVKEKHFLDKYEIYVRRGFKSEAIKDLFDSFLGGLK